MIKSELLHHALALALVGLKPVPMIAQRKRPARKGWREAASLDQHNIVAAFSAAHYADGLGVATGDGVFVIDLDRDHKDGADGVESFGRLIAPYREAQPLPFGPRSRSPRRGHHLWLASPRGVLVPNQAPLHVAGAPIAGVDVRGDGGLCMVAPSALPDGRAWRWRTAPWESAIPLAPDWLLHLVAAGARSTPPAPPDIQPYRGDCSPYARAALERELQRVAGAVRGARNDALYRAALALGSLCAAGALSVEAVASALLEAAQHCGLVADDGIVAAEHTIANGLEAGAKRPRALPPNVRGGRK